MEEKIHMQSKIYRRQASGFTLIEVMVVIVILGVLAALIVPNVMGRGEKAKVDTTVITLKGVAAALDQYKLDNDKYPSMQEGGLDALVNKPESAKNWLPGGYVKGGYPKDSWTMTFNMLHLGPMDDHLIYILLAQMDSKVVKKPMLIFSINLN